MPEAGGVLDALPIIVMGVVLVVWLGILAARRLFTNTRECSDCGATFRRMHSREPQDVCPVCLTAEGRVARRGWSTVLDYDIEPLIKRLFLWISPTLRAEVATGVSAVGFYLLLRSGLHAGIWTYLASRFADGAYVAVAVVVLVLLVLGTGLVLPPLSLLLPRLRGRARGFVALSSALVLMASLLWSSIAYGRLASGGPAAFGVRVYLVLCIVAALETALVFIGSVMLIKDSSLLERLFPNPTVDPRLVWINLGVVAALVATEEVTHALGPATVAMASLNLCGVIPRFLPERSSSGPDEPAVLEVPSEMIEDP